MRQARYRKIEGHGFIPDIITPDNYALGDGQLEARLGAMPVMQDGQWEGVVPPIEIQNRNGLETMNCTNYNTLTPIEALMKKHFGSSTDFSERYTGVLTGTTRSGNSPHKVIEIIRKEAGLVPEYMLPFSDDITTWEAYYAPNPMRRDLRKVGKQFLREYEIGHDWVFTGRIDQQERIERMMDALRFSPLGVSVVAWQKDSHELYFKEEGEIDNHWSTVIGFEYKKFWKCRDSYEGDKKLEWKYPFGMAKRYSIAKKEDQGCAISRLFVNF